MRTRVLEVTQDYYHATLNMLPSDKRVYVNKEVVADKYYLVFQGLPIGGFATNKNGYLTGVFSLVKGKGKEIFKLRLAQAKKDSKGGARLNLFCIGDFLMSMYSEYGFVIGNTIEWDDNYAPDGWNYKQQGRPNLYEMSLV